MKKTLIVFIVILVGLFLLFSFMDMNSEYAAEKTIWKINQRFAKISKDPKSAPDAAYAKVINDYEKLIKRFNKSKIVPIAYLLKGRVYVAKEEYAKAREIFEQIFLKFPDDDKAGVRALMDIGNIYALEKDDDNVVKTYQRIINKYPLSDVGLRAPLLIAKFYVDRSKLEKAENAFKDAIIYYKKLISENPNTVVEFHALRLIAGCDMAQGKWQEAVNVFEEILIKFSNPKFMNMRILDSILKSINTVSVAKLNSFDIPVYIYKKFIDKYPGHPFNKILESMVKTFQDLKEKNQEKTAETK